MLNLGRVVSSSGVTGGSIDLKSLDSHFHGNDSKSFSRKSRRFFALLMLALMFLSSCGSGSQADQTNLTGDGSAKLIIHNSTGRSSGDFTNVNIFRVTITGDGIDEAIVCEFDGDVSGGTINDIPAGTDRTVSVEAVNNRGQLIREGVMQGVSVSRGAASDVDVTMDAVPIFVGLEDGSVVSSKRLRFVLYADPEDPLEVELSSDSPELIYDRTTNNSELYPNTNTGLVSVDPGKEWVGEYQFLVRSKRTGKSSTVKIRIVDGTRVSGAPLFSGGSVDTRGEYLGAQRVGSPYFAGAVSGVNWLRVLEAQLTLP